MDALARDRCVRYHLRMRSPEELDRYRRMTVGEKIAETLELCMVAESFVRGLPAEEHARRMRYAQDSHDRSNDVLSREIRAR